MTITCSKHAINRMNQRKIDFTQVYYALRKGIKYITDNKIKYIHNNVCVIAYQNRLNVYILTVHYK